MDNELSAWIWTDCLFKPKQWLVILWFNDCTICILWDQSSKVRSQAWSQNTSQTTFMLNWDWRKCRIPDWTRTWASDFVWNGMSNRLLNLPTLKTATQNCCCSDSALRLGWHRERSSTMYLKQKPKHNEKREPTRGGEQRRKIISYLLLVLNGPRSANLVARIWWPWEASSTWSGDSRTVALSKTPQPSPSPTSKSLKTWSLVIKRAREGRASFNLLQVFSLPQQSPEFQSWWRVRKKWRTVCMDSEGFRRKNSPIPLFLPILNTKKKWQFNMNALMLN